MKIVKQSTGGYRGKSYASLWVIIPLVVILLTACTRNIIPATTTTQTPDHALLTEALPSVTPTFTATQTQVPPTPTSTPKPVGKVVIWSEAEFRTHVESVLKGFQMNYPGIQLDWVSLDPSSIIQGITKPLDAQKIPPDIVYIDANQVGAAAASGGLASLNNYLSGSLPFPPGAVKNASWNGGIYAVPLHIDPVVLYYRKDVLSRIGFDPSQNLVARSIRTWDELLSICQTIKQKVGLFCFDLNKASNDGFLYEAMLQGENLGYQGAVGLPAVDQPSNVQILEQINQFWKNGVVGDEPTWSQEWYGHISSKDQPVAFVIGPASLSSDLQIWIDPGSSNRWGIMTMPSMTSGISAGANLGGGYLGIVNGSKNEEAAWTFMNFLTQDIHSQIALYQSSGWLPAYLPAYEAQELNQPNSYYSGQVPLEIIRQSAYRLSSTPLFTPDYARIHSLMQTAIQNTALGILPPEVALKDVASKLSP